MLLSAIRTLYLHNFFSWGLGAKNKNVNTLLTYTF